MFDHIIQRLIADRCTELNPGGSGHGLYRYKSGYSGRVFGLADLSLPLTPWRWWPALRDLAPMTPELQALYEADTPLVDAEIASR
jgi:hypothetical protein